MNPIFAMLRTILAASLLLQAFVIVAPAADRQWINPKDDMVFVWVPTANQNADGASAAAALTNSFWLGRTEVTVAQFQRFVASTGYVTDAERATNRWTWKNPGFVQSTNHPVVWLSWNDALQYALWAGVDLPKESEWIHACRAGATTFSYGDDYVWHRGNASDGTRPVATRRPNAWGLYDMLGSAYEWCWIEDRYGAPEGATGYPRGGSWTRCPDRIGYDLPSDGGERYGVLPYDDDRGFRCIRRIEEAGGK